MQPIFILTTVNFKKRGSQQHVIETRREKKAEIENLCLLNQLYE